MSIPRLTSRRAFTLIELLAAIGVMLVLAALTTFGVRRIANDARMSSAKNTLTAVLANARALAMRNNEMIMVIVRPRREASDRQVIDLLLARFAGHTEAHNIGLAFVPLIDRFVVIPDAPVRSLPAGISIAGPFYAVDDDDAWVTPTYMPKVNEAPGEMIGILFGPDGTTITRNSVTDSNFFYVDFNRSGDDFANNPNYPDGLDFIGDFFDCNNVDANGDGLSDDEGGVNIVPFLVVYDDRAARELMDDSNWTNANTRMAQLSEYINKNADPIHFNRYTGVIVK